MLPFNKKYATLRSTRSAWGCIFFAGVHLMGLKLGEHCETRFPHWGAVAVVGATKKDTNLLEKGSVLKRYLWFTTIFSV